MKRPFLRQIYLIRQKSIKLHWHVRFRSNYKIYVLSFQKYTTISIFIARLYLPFPPCGFHLGIFLNTPFERRFYAHVHTYIHIFTFIWDARTRKCRFYRKARRRRSGGRYQRKPYKWPHPVDVWGRITDLKCEIVAKCAPSSSSRISMPRMNECVHPCSRAPRSAPI